MDILGLLKIATSIAIAPSRIILCVKSQEDADSLIQTPRNLAQLAKSFDSNVCEVRWEEAWDGGDRGYEVFSSLLS